MAAPLMSIDDLKVDCSKMSSLDGLKSVLIKQPVRGSELLCEMFCGCEMENLYTVQSVNEQSKQVQQLFVLKEESNCCLRQWLKLNIFSNHIYIS